MKKAFNMIVSQVDDGLIGLVMTQHEASVLKWLLTQIGGYNDCVYFQDLDKIYEAMRALNIPDNNMDCTCKTQPVFDGHRTDSPVVHATMVDDNVIMVLTEQQAATLKIVCGSVGTINYEHPIRAVTRPCYFALDKLSTLDKAAQDALEHCTGEFTFAAPNQ